MSRLAWSPKLVGVRRLATRREATVAASRARVSGCLDMSVFMAYLVIEYALPELKRLVRPFAARTDEAN